MIINPGKIRSNGFDFPLDWLQVVSWVMFPFFTGTFYVAIVPALWQHKVEAVMLTLVYTLMAMATFGYGWLATYVNPTDISLRIMDIVKEDDIKLFDVRIFERHCKVCDSYVMNSSKHCGHCNRCASGFDHHCKILNNCIGEANYGYFIKTTVLCALLLMMQSAAAIVVIVGMEGDVSAAKVLLIVETVISVPCSLLLMKLIVYHIRLWFLGMSTYEYIQVEK